MVSAAFDLSKLPENKRIDYIGQTIMNAPKSSLDKPLMIAVMVEDNTKAARYIAMMKEKYPRVRVVDQLPMGNTWGNCIIIRFGEPAR